MKPESPNLLARCLRDYFTEHLPRLRGMSPHTILNYRDSLVLLLRFLAAHRKRSVQDLDLEDFEPNRIVTFLNYLEQERKNSVPTRNVRLAAIHAFFRYVGAQHPEQLERSQRILGVPFKRGSQRVIQYLERSEIEAVLSRIDRSFPDGRRDYALLATHVQHGRPRTRGDRLAGAGPSTHVALSNEIVRERSQRKALPVVAPDGSGAARSL